MKIADIYINLSARRLDKPFSYAIPKSFPDLCEGCRVLVPFGKQLTEGFIVKIHEVAEEMTDLKSISRVLDEEPWFDQAMLKTAEKISQYYLCTMAEALRLFIPGKTSIRKKKVYQIIPGSDIELPPAAAQVYEFLQVQGKADLNRLKQRFGSEVAKQLEILIQAGAVQLQNETQRRVGEKSRLLFQLNSNVPPVQLEQIRGANAQKVVSWLKTEQQLSWDELKARGISRDTLLRLKEKQVICQFSERLWRNPYSDQSSNKSAVSLNAEQQQVCNQLDQALVLGEFQAFLLHGITGSGKTEVYLAAAQKARALGRQVIVLVPEIALTGQIIERFRQRFGDDVVVIHSRLSAGEKADSFERIKQGQAGLVIGARSAVFAPAPNLGLIILDEEHEFTYKQEERPRYHTRKVAHFRLAESQGVLLLGSATPDITSYYAAEKGQAQLLTLSKRAAGHLPKVQIVDMCQELKEKRPFVLSSPLRKLITTTLERQEQAIILLNRRGYSTFVLCRECGEVMKCPHCDVSLVYHAIGQKLCCHYCDYTMEVPDICPACRSRYIRYFGSGTQKVQAELTECFPEARILRMDQDTTGNKFAHEQMLRAFNNHEYDILLGTQMVAKGHDISKVTAVGILAIDTVLNLPDFRSAERAFDLITQAAGRAGRGEQPGQVIVQTYNASHYAVMTGAEQNYPAFYQIELDLRRQLSYPPFTKLLKLTLQGKNEALLQNKAQKLAAGLAQVCTQETHTQVIGPYTASIAKLKDLYRLQILVKGKDLQPLKDYLVQQGFWQDEELIIDIDPASML